MRHAVSDGIPVQGICLYPILDYPGCRNNRHCETGLSGCLDITARAPSTILWPKNRAGSKLASPP